MPETPLYAKIVSEIEAGLPNEHHRRDEALDNLRFYEMKFELYPTRDLAGSGDSNKFQRNSPFMRRVVDALCANLYKEGPTRDLPEHPEASEWLNDCYRRNNINALLQEADRLTHVVDFVALQVEPSSDPDWPLKIRLWDGAHLYVWTDLDDPCVAVAVATLDVQDARRRMRLWTGSSITTFLTKKWDATTWTSGATSYLQDGPKKPNTLGVLPFAFIHYAMPTTSFYGHGPGKLLRDVNWAINKRLNDIFDCCRYNLNPIVLLNSVSASFKPASPARPGDVWNLSPDLDAAGEGTVTPSATYLQADSSFVAAAWDDQQNTIDHTLEMLGVPPSSIRMEQTTAASGDAIVAEQLEPVKYAESRQRKAAIEEDELARLVLKVGAAHLGSQEYEGYRVTAAQLEDASSDLDLTLHWPDMYPRVPGQGQDQADQWLLEQGLASKTQIIMTRMKMTEEEAEAYLEQVAEHKKREDALFSMESATEPSPSRNGDGQESLETDDEELSETGETE